MMFNRLFTLLNMTTHRMFLKIMAIALIGVPAIAGAQDFEDDIYYNPAKDKKQTVKTQKTTASTVYGNNYSNDWMAADSYVYSSGSNRDVDEYNRRYTTIDTVAADSVAADDFAYTRRIQRFYNPNVVEALGDPDLVELYYSTDNTPTINVYNIDTWGAFPGSYYWPYNSWSWGWNWGFGPFSISVGNPWWGWGYNPWWGFDPYWSWNWGWGCTWGGPGWGHGGMAWRPATTSPGASRPHGYAGIGSSSGRYSGSDRLPSGATISGNRPGNMGRGRYGTAAASQSARPGAFSPGSWPSSSSSSINTSGSRGRAQGNNSDSRRNSYNSNSNDSYRNSSSGSSRSSYSGGSFGGSGRGSGGSYGGGGGHSSGGGGGRGRR
jgi:hypothetical protein